MYSAGKLIFKVSSYEIDHGVGLRDRSGSRADRSDSFALDLELRACSSSGMGSWPWWTVELGPRDAVSYTADDSS
jgi:hypothetical protein